MGLCKSIGTKEDGRTLGTFLDFWKLEHLYLCLISHNFETSLQNHFECFLLPFVECDTPFTYGNSALSIHFPSKFFVVTIAPPWCWICNLQIHSLGVQLWLSTGEDQETAKSELIECFKLLEGELGDKPYFGGETFGLVDVSLIPFSCWFYGYEQWGKISMEKECPKLVDWAHRCMKKECVQVYPWSAQGLWLPHWDKNEDWFLSRTLRVTMMRYVE